MRVHSDTLTIQAVRDALAHEQAQGRIAPHVGFKVLTSHGSRSRARGIEIQLEAQVRDNGRRAGNSGSYGAMRPEYDGYAATYDEWGWLLAALYRIDPRMLCGTPKTPVYADAGDFHHKTALSYDPRALVPILDAPGGIDPYPIVIGKAATTKRGYLIGRQGAGRVSEADHRRYWPGEYRPRTAEQVLGFARLTREDVAASAPTGEADL